MSMSTLANASVIEKKGIVLIKNAKAMLGFNVMMFILAKHKLLISGV